MNQKNNFLLLVVLLSSILSYTNAENRIMGGFSDSIVRSRHTVAIFHKRLSYINAYKCVGSIVSAKCVLTVAHCVQDIQNNRILVRAAVTYLWHDKEQQHCVEEKEVHPSYNSGTGFMDLAVLKVSESFQETATTHIIELCEERIQPLKWMEISGWGTCNENYGHPCNILQRKFVQIQQCSNATISEDLAGTLLFAQNREGSKDLSVGDTGAGGVLDEKLCAVAQRVMENSPDIYIDITTPIARNFIERQIRRG